MSRLLAVNTSPTAERGRTHRLLELVRGGAESAGAEVKRVVLRGRKIHPCRGCLRCWVKHPGRCAQSDDMAGLMDDVLASDIMVIASPVYVDGFCAQAKTFIDRLIPLIDPHFELVDGHCRHRVRHEKLPAIALVSVCGFSEADNFDLIVEHTRRMCRNLRTEFAGAVLRPASRVLTLREKMPERIEPIMQAAREAGRELAAEGRVSEQCARRVAEPVFPKELYIDGANLFWDRCIARGRFPPD
ncbi:MAG: flavodoxin family protein [Deltaproteobacteria bacterium]|nr:MAG: flavodoxin family protein [Deltaproteobacteria bacterium]